ncbi:sulfotransferase family protein [Pontibacter sp. G13]|uniref:sulfotransferase-like domain-containing protein n=1 Tax=Pontibacter sp. G13 TaxID=3074898 RepID=UPI00288B5AC7|nr:sulfotransferase family protein [Pontibacter sp. G13]WNJ20921.1 sulfotransferase family protein [Pontibacter sp. G13]
MTTKRISSWSGPRNVSTALMYAFAQRSDTRVVDEPLYAHYLRVTGLDHPGRELILAQMNQDGTQVMEQTLRDPCDHPVLYLKQMAHHMVELPESWLEQSENLFLIRNPTDVICSFSKVIPSPTLQDIGIQRQFELYQYLLDRGHTPIVVDGSELLKDPVGMLRRMCIALGLEPDDGMVSWNPGPRPEDGVWAPWWYENVHRSEGFQPYQPKTQQVPEHLKELEQSALAFYQPLFEASIKA